MTVARIKTITHRIRKRFGTTEEAAAAAGVWKSQWSDWENPDKPSLTIPLGKLVEMNLNSAERRAIAALFVAEDEEPPASAVTESSETVESAAELHKMVRLAAEDGEITEAEARPIRSKCLSTMAEVSDVLRAVS